MGMEKYQNGIQCFFEVHKVYVKGALPFNALFNDNPECSNVICAGFILSKASLFLSFLSTVSCILPRMIRQRILLGTDRSMIPLQFLHSLSLPFLGIVTTIPVFHLVGISSLSQISFSTLYKTSVVAPISAFKTSDDILSIPGALPSFSFLMALLISSLDILPQLMLRSSFVSSMSGIESGGSLFKISWKYSFQRCNYKDSLMRMFPCLSLTGRLVLFFFPASCLVILYNSLELFCLAAISASFASFSTCFLVPLCLLFNCFVSFLVFLLQFFFLVSSASLLSFILVSLLASIASQVLSVIQSFLLASQQPRTCSQVSVIAFLHLVHFSSMFFPLPMLGTSSVV